MNASKKYRILGIDPGLRTTGYGCVDFTGQVPILIEGGTIKTPKKKDLAERISHIYRDLVDVLAELKPDAVGVEQLYAHYKHPRTSILMGHARGVLLLAASQAGIAVKNVAATMVKKSLTGNGHASKRQVQLAVQSVFNLPEPPSPADVADALAIALCAGRRFRSG